jgi:Family of unknown function (DUF6186)
MSSRAITLVGYVVVLLAMVALEALSSFRRSGIPSFGQVVAQIMRTRSGRVGLLAAWAWVGLHFFAR